MPDEPVNTQAALDLAIHHQQAGRLDLAEGIYQQILEKDHGHPDALHLLGVLEYQKGNHEKGRDLIKSAIKIFPDNPFYHNNLGIVLNAQNQFEEAVIAYEQALRIDPDYSDALNNLGSALKKRGQLDPAIDCFKRAVSINQGFSPVHFNLAVALGENKQFEEAIAHYQRAIEADPGLAEAHYNLGNLLKDQGRLAEAAGCYQRAIEANPSDPDSHNNLGNCLKEQGRSKESIDCFRRAAELAPDDTVILFNLGNVLNDLDRYEEAVACYQRGLDLAPNNPQAHHTLGKIFKDIGRWEDAITSFQKALDLNPDNLSARHLLAALKEETTEAAPLEYVETLFDYYSSRFDDRVLNYLNYQTPSLLRQALAKTFANLPQFKNVLDLGCGTGLAGKEFQAVSDRLVGVDISKSMIQEAQKKNIYNKLKAQEIVAFLDQVDDQFDLIIAADVFVYTGNLTAIFKAVKKRTLDRAYFLFSTEISQEKDYVLNKSGRYGHSRKYIHHLAECSGFAVKFCETAQLRKHRAEWVTGDLYILQRLP